MNERREWRDKEISRGAVLCYCVLLLGGEWEGERGWNGRGSFTCWTSCPVGQSSVTSLRAVLSCRTESQIFKARFKNWNDVLAVDFTCTPEMLEKRKIELVCHSV